MSTPMIAAQSSTADPNLQVVREFLDEQGAALCHACQLLGGAPAHRKCLRLISSVSLTETLGRSDILELIQLHRLLTLQMVGDPERIETGLFSAIDPADPRVHDICLLADRLHDLLTRITGEVEDLAEALAATGTHRAA